MAKNIYILSLLILLLPGRTFPQSGFDTPGALPDESHPFILYANSTERDTFEARCQGRSPYSTWYDGIKSEYNSLMDGTPMADLSCIQQGEISMYGSIVYLVEEITEAKDSAIVALKNSTSCDNQFVKARAITGKNIGYDVLCDLGELTETEKNTIRDELQSLTLSNLPIEGEFSNKRLFKSFDAILTALNIEGRDSTWAQDKLDLALVGIDSCISYATDSTGIWSEGPKYTEFGWRYAIYTHNAYKNATGRDFMDDDYFPNLIGWWLRCKRSNGYRDWPFDDAQHRTKTSIPAFQNPSLYGDSLASMAASYLASQDLGSLNVYPMQSAVIAFYEDSVQADTTGMASFAYEDEGFLFMNDYWSGAGYEIVFLSETYNWDAQDIGGANHEHWDANSICAFWNGNLAVIDPGYGQDTPTGWSYSGYFKRMEAHNTFSGSEADGTDQEDSQGFDHIFLDYDQCYAEGKFSNYYGHDWYRGVLFWSKHWITVFDWIYDNDADNTYRYYWLLPGRNQWVDNTVDKYVRTDTLGIGTHVYGDVLSISKIENDDWIYEYEDNEYGGAGRHAFVDKNATAEEDKVAVFSIQSYPSGGSSIATDDDGNGVKAYLGSDTLRSYIQLTNSQVDKYGIQGNGKMMAVADTSDVVQFFAATDCDSLKKDNSLLFSCSTNLDAIMMSAVEVRDLNEIRGYVDNESGSYTFEIGFIDFLPKHVFVDGNKINSTWSSGNLSFTIAESGKHSIRLVMPQKNESQIF